jgi:hypothetical protein
MEGVLDHLQDRREEVEPLRDLLPAAHPRVRGVVGAGLLGVAEIVDSLDAGQPIPEGPPAPLATLVGEDVDLFLALVSLRLVAPRLGLVEKPQRIDRRLLALRRETLGAQQAEGLFKKLDATRLLVDQRRLIARQRFVLFEPCPLAFDASGLLIEQHSLREHKSADRLDRTRKIPRVTPYGPNREKWGLDLQDRCIGERSVGLPLEEIDAVQQPVELATRPRHPVFRLPFRPGEAILLETLLPEHEAIALPMKDVDPIPIPIPKHGEPRCEGASPRDSSTRIERPLIAFRKSTGSRHR